MKSSPDSTSLREACDPTSIDFIVAVGPTGDFRCHDEITRQPGELFPGNFLSGQVLI